MPLKPSKSRIVEAVCILLCQKYPEAQMTSGAGKIVSLSYSVVRSFHVCSWAEANLSVPVEADCATVQCTASTTVQQCRAHRGG